MWDYVLGKIKDNEVVEATPSEELEAKLPDSAKGFTNFPWWNKFVSSKRNCAPPFHATGTLNVSTLFASGNEHNAYLSNFFRGDPIMIWGEEHSSVEKFVGLWKARFMGDKEAENSIKAENKITRTR